MEKSNKRGKIPQSDWPQIMARYEAGETLASIAKTYDCSPPAISYIVSRSRARDATVAAAPAMTEPQLIKTHPYVPMAHAPAEAPVETTAPEVAAVQNGATAAVSVPLFAQDAPTPRRDESFASPTSTDANGAAGHDNGAGFAVRNGADHDSGNRDS